MLSLEKVQFSYSNRSDVSQFCLDDISMNITKGDFLTIVGPNGSGKSTLLKIISGVVEPDTGFVSLNNKKLRDYTRKELARTMAYVPQAFSSAFPFSVYEIVMMGRTPYLNHFGYEKENDLEIVKDALEVVGIYHLRNKGINEVSGGEAQRAFIARALAQKPKIMLLDEPTAHLDIEHQIGILNLLEKLNIDMDLNVLMVSHDLTLAGYYGERLIMMKEGKIIFDDKKAAILTQENIFDIFHVNSIVSRSSKNNCVKINIIPKEFDE